MTLNTNSTINNFDVPRIQFKLIEVFLLLRGGFSRFQLLIRAYKLELVVVIEKMFIFTTIFLIAVEVKTRATLIPNIWLSTQVGLEHKPSTAMV